MKGMKKWAALLAMLVCAALMAGCVLARIDDFAGQDELVGVYVRLQPDGWQEDDFFDYDEQAVMDYLQAHASQLSGGEFTPPEGLGVSSMHIVTDEERAMCMLWEDQLDELGGRSVGVAAGPVFSAVHQAISVTDEGENVEVSAVLPLDAAVIGEEACLDIYPVYRRPDGVLYAAPDNGMMGYLDGFSETISTEATQTGADGKTVRQSRSYTVRAEVKPRVDSAKLIEMDADNNLIASREIDLTRESLVERIQPDAAWVLLEMHATEKIWDEPARESVLREAICLKDGKGEAALYLPSSQAGILAARTLTVAYPGVSVEDGI